jgi:hypothetical protein
MFLDVSSFQIARIERIRRLRACGVDRERHEAYFLALLNGDTDEQAFRTAVRGLSLSSEDEARVRADLEAGGPDDVFSTADKGFWLESSARSGNTTSEVFGLKPTSRRAPTGRNTKSACGKGATMEPQTPWIGTEDNPHTANWRNPHRGRDPDLSDSAEMAESIPCGICAALDGADLRSGRTA